METRQNSDQKNRPNEARAPHQDQKENYHSPKLTILQTEKTRSGEDAIAEINSGPGSVN